MTQSMIPIQKYRWLLSSLTELEETGQLMSAAEGSNKHGVEGAKSVQGLQSLGNQLHPTVVSVLQHRGFDSLEMIQRFLEPKLSGMHDPDLLPGCLAAARRIIAAIDAKRPVVIYGDYDVDGVTASSILWHALRAISEAFQGSISGSILGEAGEDNAEERSENKTADQTGEMGGLIHTYIPHRLEEGYGINCDALREIKSLYGEASQVTVISVDCGITAVAPAQLARELGMELIITDHHTFNPDDLPDADVIVHPSLPGSAYPFAGLCGAGVAYKLAWQLFRVRHGYTGDGGSAQVNLPDKLKKWMLDLLPLTALGTVADVVPLRDENRILTWYGLGRLKQTPLIGLRALIESVGLQDASIDSFHVGFVLGPRLNACGRMGHARDALKLLTSANEVEARDIAAYLDKENGKRQRTEKDIVKQAISMVEELGLDGEDQRAIVVAGEDWHPGVVGIVASRLVDRFARPAIVLNINGEEAHGSARSVEGVCLHTALSSCSELLVGYGGHAMAAGLRLKLKDLAAFREKFIACINEELSTQQLKPLLKIDASLDLRQINWSLAQQLKQLAPFGSGNRTPVLLLKHVILDQKPRVMGKTGEHLKLVLRHEEAGNGQMSRYRGQGYAHGNVISRLPLFAPGMAELANQLRPGDKLDVAMEVVINEWQGRKSIEGRLRDLCFSRDESRPE